MISGMMTSNVKRQEMGMNGMTRLSFVARANAGAASSPCACASTVKMWRQRQCRRVSAQFKQHLAFSQRLHTIDGGRLVQIAML